MFKIFFRDAYKWYEAKILQSYTKDKVKPRTKRKKFSDLKKKAPKVPDYTCPTIDNVLDTLSSSPNIKAGEWRKVKSKLEKLRRDNERLRESGIYWYEIAKAVFKPK
tara:strand:- start:595 stop:915 length:321 start_codon:yes stop_codon:yes gene_type:complete